MQLTDALSQIESAEPTNGLASILDMDGNGNPLDDSLGMAAQFVR